MTVELRGGLRSAPVAGSTPAEREALRFAPDPRSRDADAGHIVASACEDERDGIASTLVTQSSSWPEPFAVAAWALQATASLRVVSAHRIGTIAPTIAARTLATLHRLSGGRAGVHLILGSSDDDVHRDGDTLNKQQRYERAAEFAEVFTRALTSPEPFDFTGDHYDIRDAWSGVRLPAGERPEISFAGSSEAGIALAARYADVYGIAMQPVPETRAMIDRVQEAAGRHDRRLRIWSNASFLLAGDEASAANRARRIVERLDGLTEQVGDPAWIVRDRRGGGVATDPRPAVAEHARAMLDRSFVGTPAGAAAAARELIGAGVDVLQIQLPLESDADRALRRELIEELLATDRTGSAQPGGAAVSGSGS